MATTEKVDLNAMMDDMGPNEPARTATRKYIESLIAEALQYSEKEIRHIAWGYYKGYLDGLKDRQ